MHEGGHHLLQLQEQALAGLVAVGVHVESRRSRGRKRGQLLLVLLREQGDRGYGDGFVACREHGPAVGAAFCYVERLAGAEQVEHGQVVDATFRAAGEAEPWHCAPHEVAVLHAHQLALAAVVGDLQPADALLVAPRGEAAPADHSRVESALIEEKAARGLVEEGVLEVAGVVAGIEWSLLLPFWGEGLGERLPRPATGRRP